MEGHWHRPSRMYLKRNVSEIVQPFRKSETEEDKEFAIYQNIKDNKSFFIINM